MKKNILKYSSLLALLSAPFFSTQTFAAECETGTVPATGCRIDISDITYTLTGDVTVDDADGAGILIQIPDAFFKNEFEVNGLKLPPLGDYAVGMCFLPQSKKIESYVNRKLNR